MVGREGRKWVAMDCDLASDPRILNAGRDGKDLFIQMVLYCGKHSTDGRVTAKALPRLAVDAMMTEAEAIDAVDALVAEGVLEDTADGWYVTRYLLWNRSRAEVEADEKRILERRAKGKERLARWRAAQGDEPLTSADDSVTRYSGNALPGALPNAKEERRGDTTTRAPTKQRGKAERPITPDARRLAKLLLDRYFEFKPNSTRIEVSNESKRGIQELLDLGPPGAKEGVPAERIEQMIELLHTRGRTETWGNGTCWAEQVRSGKKLRAKWTDFEGRWMNEPAAKPNGQAPAARYVRPGLSFEEQQRARSNR